MAKVLKVSRSGYYAYRKRSVSRREVENRTLLNKIREIHKKYRQVYGAIRITAELKAQGYSCSKGRVARLMRKHNIVALTKRKFKTTTLSKHQFSVSPNLLQKPFTASDMNQIWTSDITYIRTAEGWLYLAVICDVYSRAIVGWSMQSLLHRDLVIEAFNQAIMRRKPPSGLIFHSDRGIQYACSDFRNVLKEHHCIQSMSGKGNCYDNAISESFFGTLKTELVHQTNFSTRAEAKQAIFDYLEVFYNRQRRHSSLGYISPYEFECRNLSKCA